MDPTGEHPLRKLGPKTLVCSACKMVTARFKAKVARKIKGKWAEAKKRSTFAKLLPEACAEAGYPEQMAIIERNDEGQIIIDFNDAMSQGGGGALSIKKMGADVKKGVIEACKHLFEVEFKEALTAKLLSKPKRDG